VKELNDENKNIQSQIDEKLAGLIVSEFINNKIFVVNETTKVKVATEIILNHKLPGLCVLGADEKLVGVVSEKELIVQLAAGQLNSPLKFTKAADYVKSSTIFKETLVKMIIHNRKWLPVVDSYNKVIGTVERSDILKVLLNNIRP